MEKEKEATGPLPFAIGTRFKAIVPIQLSEYEDWPEGTEAEIAQIDPWPEGNAATAISYKLKANDGSSGWFAQIDLHGEHAWFRQIN